MAELVCAASDPQWLERRREGITATDIVTIAGLVTWDSPWALYHRKLGLLLEVEQSDRMRLGSWLEDRIAAQWFSDHPREIMEGSALYRSRARRWQLATVDRLITNEAPLAVLECKTSATRQGWGDDGSDVVPAHVRAQVLWQMDTLGVSTGHVAVVFLPSGEFRSYTIRHHPACEMTGDSCLICAVCSDQISMQTIGGEFWDRIQRRDPPDLDGLEVTTDALRYLHPAPGGAVELDRGLLREFDFAAEQKRDTEAVYRNAQNHIRWLMGDAHEATADGKVVFRRTVGKRAGYTVPPGETDTLRRIGKDKTDAD